MQNKHQEDQRLSRAQSITVAEPYKSGDLVYLLYPRNTDLQTNTMKFKVSWLGPLMVEHLIDERNCTLADLEGRPLSGVFNIKRLKRAYFRGEQGNISNIEKLKNDVQLLDSYRKNFPGIAKIQPGALLCQSDGTIPKQIDLNKFLSSTDSQPLLMTCAFDLNLYLQPGPERPVAMRQERHLKNLQKDVSRDRRLPAEDSELSVKRARYKDGILQILVCQPCSGYYIWLTPSTDLHKEVYDLCIIQVLNQDSLPTGRIIVCSKGLAKEPFTARSQKSVRVTGSILRFDRARFGKPSVPASKDQKLVKKVRFETD